MKIIAKGSSWQFICNEYVTILGSVIGVSRGGICVGCVGM
jgi:hypothetical protein